MTNSRRSRGEPLSRRKRIAAETAGAGGLEIPLRGARGHLDENVRAWIADLTAVNAALRHGIGDSKNKSVSEALERLERLEAALHQAPEQIVEHVGRRTAMLASAGMAQMRRIDELEAAESKLASTNERLREENYERERLERDAREAERGLREVRERFESAFDNAPIGMALIAMDDRWLQVNDALCRITGHTEEQLRATTLRAMTHPDDIDLDAQSLRQLLAGQIPSYQVEKRYHHAWGHYAWVLVTVSIVRDEDRDPLYVVTQVQDISERKDLARRLEFFVDHDFLTGLFNRRHFEQKLADETERVARYGAPGAVLVIDLDNFKDVNDTFGHKAGDDVLKGVAGLLRQRLRQTDVVARLGGDEFAVLLPHADADHAQSVADEIVKALGRQTAVLADQSIRITASIGVSTFAGLTDIEVLAYADLAMYEAKETGRNRFAMYRPATAGNVRGSTRLVEAERIRHALEEDRLILYCQPILDLSNNEICQYELLLRLPDENKGEPLPPSAFLYGAERFGLIQAIDGWVVRRAIALIAEHASVGLKLVLNVNLSGKSIGDRKLVALIEEVLAEAAIDPARLTFELTETAAITNVEEAKAFASRLRGRGCQFALDDFGAGFGSFYYLKSFPFDYLKIDGDFIRGLATSPVDQLVVKAIVNIARGMGKKTVAEFVADEETSRLLREIGVDFAQGYHIGVPRPISEVLQTRGGPSLDTPGWRSGFERS
jgi:diguanylate cyclase (GGDEF)-like protein/PAS domain S-box-containing protein